MMSEMSQQKGKEPMENNKIMDQLFAVYDSLNDDQKKRIQECKTVNEIMDFAGKEKIELPDDVLDAISGGYIFIDQYMGGKDYQVINDTTGEVMQTLSQHTAAEDRARWHGQSTEIISYDRLKEIRKAQKKNHNAC